MAYLASNEPYGRVDEGVGSGLVGGAIIGGALGTGSIYGGSSALDRISQFDANRTNKSKEKFEQINSPTESQVNKAERRLNHASGRQAGYAMAKDYADKLGGMGGKSKLATAAGVSVLGGLLGATVDGLND